MSRVTFVLPGGYIDERGVLHREVDLAPLTGREEELLVDSNTAVTAILSRCLRRLGTIGPVPGRVVRRLLVADRQFLLLKLRAITFGDGVQATLRCPWTDCGQKIDIDFSLRDLPVTESREKGPIYTMVLSEEQEDRTIAFCLPTGEDQEAVLPIAAADGDSEDSAKSAFTTLLKRCVQGAGSWDLSPQAQQAIERRMEAVSPKVELTIAGLCPECGRNFEVPLDPRELLFGELRAARDLLHREVHYLAYHYHWSEEEIMRMTRSKRQRYIEVLSDELERMNYGNQGN